MAEKHGGIIRFLIKTTGKRRPSRLPVDDYHEYIKSDEWWEKATMAKWRAGERCQVCNGTYRLEAHHRSYERWGHEDKGDITVLCRDCHQVFHDNGRLVKE